MYFMYILMVWQLRNAEVGIDKICISLDAKSKNSYFHELCQMDDKLVPKQIILSSGKYSTSILDVLRIFTYFGTSLCTLYTF